ncbi:hypothetical protein ACO0SA_001968 [Hanseniaspora valbyensis]
MCISFSNGKPKSTVFKDTKHKFQLGQYYSNWSPYSPYNFFPEDIDMRHTTHIYYSFISIDSKTGNVYYQDIEADTKLKTKEIKENGLIIEFNQMRHNKNDYFETKDAPIRDHVFPDFNPYDYSMKKQKNFKLIMSIGGWSQKNNFSNLSKKAEHLNNFIDSCINLVLSNGFDGIDIDWEYPTKKKDIDTYIEIFKRLRARFDKLEQEIFFSNKQKKNRKEKWFYLSTAIPCGKEVLSKLDLQKIEPFVDCFNLMGYDLSGEWSEYTAYHSNLFDDPNNKDSSSVDSVVKYMLNDLKLPSQKIILGMPLYGRSFTNVKIQNSKIIGVPFKGVDNDFDRDSPGIWPYSAIFDLKYTSYYDAKLVAAYVYNEKKKHLIVFDDYNCIEKKAEYIKKMNLGGGFFWEANGERTAKFPERILPHFSDFSCLSFDKHIESIWNQDEMLNYFTNLLQNRASSQNNDILSKQAKKVYNIIKQKKIKQK